MKKWKKGVMRMERHKKKNFASKIFAGLLALVMLSGLLGIPALADDTTTGAGQPFQVTDAYDLVLESGNKVKQYDYYSPYVPYLTYNGSQVEGTSILFGLQEKSGNSYVYAYCTDMPVEAVDDSEYQRLNLTDSTYAATHADKLRAIVLGSFPKVDITTLQSSAQIEGLTEFEAVTATQLAIWKTAHDDTVQITDFLGTLTWQSYGNSDSGHTDEAKAEYNAYQSGTNEHQAGVKSRIEALYNYLMALPERTATSTVISTASFTDRATAPTVTPNDDGTCNVTVTATVDIPTGSNVKLTAFLTDNSLYYETTAVSVGTNEYTITIENVPASLANGSVTLSLDGTQTVSEDVFLLDAEGIRGVSQSMIAPLSGTMPVHAEVKAEPDRVINIVKTDKDKRPLSGISFEVYKLGTPEDLSTGKIDVKKDYSDYKDTSTLVGTITTGADGTGSLNLSTEDGVYLVKELPNQWSSDSVAFIVCLPDYSDADGDGDPYTITAQPKNTVVYGGIEIDKVDQNGNPLSGATFAVYRRANADELAGADVVVYDGTEIKMIPVQFYAGYTVIQEGTDTEIRPTGSLVSSITSEGKTMQICLPYGTYYLVETKAPDGYNKLKSAKEFVIGPDSHSETSKIKIVNSTGTELPSTGGIGTGVFTVAGLFCMAGATVVLCKKKRT